MSHGPGVTRRGFLRNAAAAAAAPLFLRASALGQGASLPSDRLAMGCIGIGGQGSNDTQAFLASPDSQIVAVCDVTPRAASARGNTWMTSTPLAAAEPPAAPPTTTSAKSWTEGILMP